MNNPKYLRDKAYYEDRYDHTVVDRCRLTEKTILEDKTKTELTDQWGKRLLRVMLYFETGEFYADREKTIQKWMAEDKWRDDKYANTPIPSAVCRLCNSSMEFGDKNLRLTDDLKKEHMVFCFVCKKCKVTAWISENGKREDHIPWQCPDCKRKLEEKGVRTKTTYTIDKYCGFCGYKKTEKFDFRVRKQKPISAQDDEQYRIDKARFCLSYKEGSEYIHQKSNLQQLSELVKEKPKKPALINMNFPEVEIKLQTLLAEHGFEKLAFDKPKMDAGVTVPFTVQDVQNLGDYKSRLALKRLIRHALKQSNWRLLTENVDYKLGILTGRLKGDERPDGCYIEQKGRIEFVKF